MSIKQPEALRLAEILEGDYCPEWFYETGVDEVSAELRAQHARITELEAARFAYASEFAPTSDGDPDVSSIHANIRALKAQLAQRFDAADMATAAAQGFRDGVASLTAQAADSVPAPAPPPECETEAEKRAFAFGWFKALESERMKAESVQEDAALWRWLAEYLVGTRTDLDDEIVASETVNDLRKLVKAAIKQGEKQ